MMAARKLVVSVLAVLIGAGTVLGQPPSGQARRRPRQAVQESSVPQPKTNQTPVTVVSADMAGRKLTFVDVEADTNTWAVEGKALEKLSALKKGEKILITWRANEQGVPQAILDVTPSPAPSPAASPQRERPARQRRPSPAASPSPSSER